MTTPGTVWRTVRHLRPEQLLGRITFRLARPRPVLASAPPRRRQWVALVRPPARESSLQAPDRFTFLGEAHALSDVGWDDPQLGLLWRYNLHYFDDLNAAGAEGRRDLHRSLMGRWMADNPAGRGTAWAPYPTSLRVANWIKLFLGGFDPDAALLDSLATQVRWLGQRLEWHVLGNHLFVNAKALIMAGLFFDGDEAAGWLADGICILERELPEQILTDGGQFERSTMYHALAVDDVLDLLQVVRACGADIAGSVGVEARQLAVTLTGRMPAMLRWLACMSHPDGRIASFNDAAVGIAPPNDELWRVAGALGLSVPTPPTDGVTVLADSGYVRVQRGAAVGIVDVAPIGPDYLLAHAHADTLTFEVSVRGRRLVVNGGTSRYGTSPERVRERGTAAHNTVEIAGQDSSEVWSGFRVGRRARVTGVAVDGWQVQGAHDGYRFLPGAPVHRRHWLWEPDAVTVTDTVSSASSSSTAALARFHLAPGLQLVRDGARWAVREDEQLVAVIEVLAGDAHANVGTHAPRFGVVEPVDVLVVRLRGGCAITRFSWAAKRDSAATAPSGKQLAMPTARG